jgi:hypothetical protein
MLCNKKVVDSRRLRYRYTYMIVIFNFSSKEKSFIGSSTGSLIALRQIYMCDVINDWPASCSVDDKEGDEDAHEEEDEHCVLHELDVLAVVARGRLWSIHFFGQMTHNTRMFWKIKKT